MIVVLVVNNTPAPFTILVLGVTVATFVFTLLHVPPAVAELSVVERPAHMTLFPVMPAGSGFTTNDVVATQPVDANV
jgi:hypothetical protein